MTLLFLPYSPIRKRRNRQLILPTWDLVRGTSQRYNVAAKLTGTRTGWELLDPPSGFRIGSRGTITTRVPNLLTEIGTLVVRTDQGEIHIPTTIRDRVSTDYRTPRHFFSMARSYNGAADVDLFDVSVRNLERTEVQTLTIASGADGYADPSPFNSTPPSTLFYVSRLYNQPNPLAHATVVNDAFPLVGYKDASGTGTLFQSPNGMLALRGTWSASDLGFTESALTMGAAQFQTPNDANSDFETYHALACIARRRESSGARIQLGDRNMYPGFVDVSSQEYRYRTTQGPANVQLSDEAELEWFAWSGARNLTDVTPNTVVTTITSQIFALDRDYTNKNYIQVGGNHPGRGNMEFIFDRYDFSEFYVHNLPNSIRQSGAFSIGERFGFANNAVAQWTGKSHTYNSRS